MATSSVISSFAAALITLQLLMTPASAGPHLKYIDAVCDRSHDVPFCIETLTENPPTAAPIALLPLAEAVMAFALSYAENTTTFIKEKMDKDPSFAEIHKAYLDVAADIKSATLKLKNSPDTANYDVIASMENTKTVMGLIRKNNDEVSTELKEMNFLMEKLLDLAAGAADAVDDDDENIHRRE